MLAMQLFCYRLRDSCDGIACDQVRARFLGANLGDCNKVASAGKKGISRHPARFSQPSYQKRQQ
jgi:hypothetical protein